MNDVDPDRTAHHNRGGHAASGPGSPSWMMARMQLPQAARDMGIDLGGGKIGGRAAPADCADRRHDRADEWRSGAEHAVTGLSMPARRAWRLIRCQNAWRVIAAPRAVTSLVRAATGEQLRPGGAQIFFQPAQRLLAEWHQAVLATLPSTRTTPWRALIRASGRFTSSDTRRPAA